MSLDLMPDDCLLHIFNFIADPKVLFRCLRVCRRWNYLVSYRLSKVEMLLDEQLTVSGEKSLCYYPVRRPLEEPILSKILEKSPRMKVVSLGFEYGRPQPEARREWLEKSLERLSKVDSIKGIILNSMNIEWVETLPQNIESLSSINTIIKTGHYPRVKQLWVEDDVFIESIECFPCLERLNLRIVADYNEWYAWAMQKQHLFKNLKIVEIDSTFMESQLDENYACRFLDFCPQVESVHLRIAVDQLVINDNYTHDNVTNLVVTYVDFDLVEHYYLNLLCLVKRYPNIKHLSIRSDLTYIERYMAEESDLEDLHYDSCLSIKEQNLKGSVVPFQIVTMLKNLVLLDMRNIEGVDEISAEYVRKYCKRHGRSVKFYFGSCRKDTIVRDWPELFSDKSQDCRGMNFMKQLFLSEYPARPIFLD